MPWETPTFAELPRPRTACCRLRYERSRRAESPKGPRLATRCSSFAVRSRTWTRAGRPESRKFLGVIPFGDKVTDYFRRYESAQGHLNGILHALRNGQDELTKDNVALNLEKQNLWGAMGRLNAYIYVAERLDARLAATIAQLEISDPERAKALSQDVLFYVRQKHQDLLTQLAVSIQSYLAIDIIIKNNIELIKGVDRASTTTISALRTAVIVAQALGNQRLVLDQITALNTTTSDLIQRTSEMMRDNSAQIQQQAASATIGLPQLQAAFQNIYATMDSIDNFKLQALDTMAATIGTLETEVAKSREYLDRVQPPRSAAGLRRPGPRGWRHPRRAALTRSELLDHRLCLMGFKDWIAAITGRRPQPSPTPPVQPTHQQRRPNPTSCGHWIASRTWSAAAWCRRRFSPGSAALPRPYARPCPGCVTSGSAARRRTR